MSEEIEMMDMLLSMPEACPGCLTELERLEALGQCECGDSYIKLVCEKYRCYLCMLELSVCIGHKTYRTLCPN